MSKIDIKYSELGAATGVLGKPVTSEAPCQDGKGHYRDYENGSIYWTPETGAHAVYGLIWHKWKALGFEKGSNGYPTTDEADTQSKRVDIITSKMAQSFGYPGSMKRFRCMVTSTRNGAH